MTETGRVNKKDRKAKRKRTNEFFQKDLNSIILEQTLISATKTTQINISQKATVVSPLLVLRKWCV